jgi:alpha-tubulin suppressor-like RCC1 family protein
VLLRGGAKRDAKQRRARRLVIALVIALVAVAAVGGTGQGLAAPGTGSGSVLAFGINQYGQLGSMTNNGSPAANPAPAAVALPEAAGPTTQVAIGPYHSLVLTASDQLHAFGNNAYGELGNTTNNGSFTANPAPALITLPGEVGHVTQIAAGEGFSLVVTSSGQLYAFGSNGAGQLGTTVNSGATTANPMPTLVTLPGEIGPVTQVAAGASHTLVVTSSGQLYAFGSNNTGQLGNPTNIGSGLPNSMPTLVALPGQIGPVTQVAAGGDDSLALTSSGQVYGFGLNYYGQLGSSTDSGTMTPAPPTLASLPAGAGTVTQIASGGSHSLVLTSSGQVYAFGWNYYGQLGSTTNNTSGNPNPAPTLVSLPGEVGPVTQIAAGENHSLAVTSSGQLYAFGWNYYGQLGNATNNAGNTANPTPTLVAFPAGTTIDTVAKGSGAYFSLALVADLAISTSALAPAQVGTPYQAALQASGGTAPLRWSAQGLPAGFAVDAASGVVTGTAGAVGSFSPTVTLTDVYGISVSHTFALSILAAAVVPPSPRGATAPRLTALKQSAGRWLLGSRQARFTSTVGAPLKKHGLPVGTTFSFSLDQNDRVALTFRHTASGRRVSGKCVARTPRTTGKPHCTRTLTDGVLRAQAHAGGNHLHFEGSISRQVKLKAGRHSVTITATSTAGKTSAPKTLGFTIAPR